MCQSLMDTPDESVNALQIVVIECKYFMFDVAVCVCNLQWSSTVSVQLCIPDSTHFVSENPKKHDYVFASYLYMLHIPPYAIDVFK